MVAAGGVVSRADARVQFTNAVQTAAHNTIVYHSTNRHVGSGITAAVGNYAADNPGSGISDAGIGTANAVINGATMFNHMNAATYNLTHIRNCTVNFIRTNDGGSVTTTATVTGMTVRPTSVRQTVSGVANAGVVAGSVVSAASANNLCTNMFNKWNALKNNASNFNVSYCHSSCHTSCHTSRGRR